MKKNIIKPAGLVFMVFIFMWGLRTAADPLDGADARIKKYRTREVALKLQDEKGAAISGARAQISMERHQFLFGCNLFAFNRFPNDRQNVQSQKLWSELFNYATVPVYLKGSGSAEGEGNLNRAEEMVDWCRSRKIVIKGHPLIWHTEAGNAEWLPADQGQLEDALKERVQNVVSSFRGRISYWDLLNEPTMAWRYDTPIAKWENSIGPVKAYEKSLKWAKDADPDALYLVNDFNIHPFEVINKYLKDPDLAMQMLKDPVEHYSVSYKNFVATVKKDGYPPDAVGIQSHMHKENWSLTDLKRIVSDFSRLHIPIHFTETTIISGKHHSQVDWDNWEKNSPWPTTSEGEKEQAEYVEQYYKLLFSEPGVEAIAWWDFSDYRAWLNAPAGLIRADASPKPAYEKLHRLIRDKWWTNENEAVNGDGEVRFRGFCGDYSVTVAGRKGSGVFTIDCRKKDGQKITAAISKRKLGGED
jgi:GH35 family endo-1,4-beta-xylanase